MLDCLNYSDSLYHYTSEESYQYIVQPKDWFDDCISLQFTRIDCMTKNDQKERKHIEDTVEQSIQIFLKQHKIDREFADAVINYKTNHTGLSIQKVKDTFYIDIDKVNYYVACFSTNSDNQYIRTHFHAPKCISFLPIFSQTFCPNPQNDFPSFGNSFMSFPTISFPPYPQLHTKWRLFYNLKRVVYDDTKKIEIITQDLLEIYQRSDPKDISDLKHRLQAMYSTYDAFFKAKQIGNEEYFKEEEVRFVIEIPNKISDNLQSQGKIKFDTNKEHLYLPIDKRFLKLN